MDFRKIAIVLIALMVLPFVSAQHPMTLTVDTPAAGFQWNSDNKILDIQFTVTDDNGITDLTTELFWSLQSGGNDHAIVADYNIILNTCASTDSTTANVCHYFWDARKLSLVNSDIYVDVNVVSQGLDGAEQYDVNTASNLFSVNNRALQGTVSSLLDIVLLILAALAIIAVIGILMMAITGRPIVEALVIGIGTIITLVILAIVLQFFLAL